MTTNTDGVMPGSNTPQLLAGLEDFYAYLPTNSFIFAPSGELWSAQGVNAKFPNLVDNGIVFKPTAWLAKKRPIAQIVWDPNNPQIVQDVVMRDAGYISREGVHLFNLYRPAEVKQGNPLDVTPWLNHLMLLYPEDYKHIENYFAFKVQYPGKKINHALVMGGAQGIGKDTLLDPVKLGIGPWNWQEISPEKMMGRFNGWAKSVMLRISEARDMGDSALLSFYEQSKTLFAGPPDVIRIDEKNLREYYVANVCGVVITTNHKAEGLYLPADDRRHYVAWSDMVRDQFDEGYWNEFYGWLDGGGRENVVAYLWSKDLRGFDPKAPPRKTPAFWDIVNANETHDDAQLRDVIESMGNPDVLPFSILKNTATDMLMTDLMDDLSNPKLRRKWPTRLGRVGYCVIRNEETEDGLFTIAGKRQAVYVSKRIPQKDRLKVVQSYGK